LKYDQSDLKSLGLKATGPRLRILALFQKAALTEKRHLTADEVFSQLKAEGEDVGLATVYRVLTQFEVAGLLRRHHFDTESASYELGEPEHHDHLVCLQCGKIEEFVDVEIERRQQESLLDSVLRLITTLSVFTVFAKNAKKKTLLNNLATFSVCSKTL